MSTEANKAIVRRLLEEPWKNMEVVDELVDRKSVAYDPSLPEPIHEPEGLKQNFSTHLTAFAGAHITVDDQIAEGELMGTAPTGKQVTVSGITISRLANGRGVEEWIVWGYSWRAATNWHDADARRSAGSNGVCMPPIPSVLAPLSGVDSGAADPYAARRSVVMTGNGKAA